MQLLKSILVIICCLGLSFANFSCSPSKTHKLAHRPKPPLNNALPRINPTYIHWLSQQSMLGRADSYIDQVSGTTRIWQNTGVEERFRVFLEAAPNWLELNPYLTTNFQAVFRAYARSERLGELAALGIRGLFIAPTGESAAVWSDEAQSDPSGMDQVSFSLASAAGSDKDFESLIEILNQNNFQLGGLLPPAATGLGPDFMLEMRAAPGFQGLYAVVEIPRKYWPNLPKADDEWLVKPLPKSVVETLSLDGYLPLSFVRDKLPWGANSGWAVTGVVRCADGSERRWAYYYARNPKRPVLLWQDPSGHARKIYSAAVIRHTGLQQQTLAAIKLAPWFGLESTAADIDPHKLTLEARLEPGLSALGAISQEIRRYGGWSVLADQFAPSATSYLLSKTDFVRDNYTQAAFDYAYLKADAEPLKAMLRLAIQDKVAQKRLAHGLLSWEKTSWLPLLDLPNGPELVAKVQDMPNSTDKLTRELFWLGLPGILFVEQNFLPTSNHDRLAKLGTRDAKITQKSLDLGEKLLAREKFKVAQGEILPPLPSSKATIVILNQLPANKYWLTCVNFSEQPQKVETQLPGKVNATQIKAFTSLSQGVAKISGHSLSINLTPKEVKSFLLQSH
ncbi:MAG: hypothetical protein IJT59_01295 [Desulfovibrionaceae bacterium]|nr:hypothetical protein [Desulfovibrionaceae bacterium]